MPYFYGSKLLDPSLPAELSGLVSDLARFQELCASFSATDVAQGDPRRTELRDLHETLLLGARALLPAAPGHVSEAEARLALLHGVRLTEHYEASVLGSTPLIDTAGSTTLRAFRTDVSTGTAGLREAATRAFSPTAEEIARLDALEQHELQQLHLRQAVMTGLDALFPLESAQDVHALFLALYPQAPVVAGEVEVVRTGTSLLFALMYTDGVLDAPASPSRGPVEQAEVSSFLREIGTDRQAQFAHFPMFGSFRGEDADPELLSSVAEAASLSASHVAQTLTTMVTTLRRQQLDQFLVHDLWGHQWQSLLLPFEDQYQALARFGEVPSVDERYGAPGEISVSLKNVVERAGPSLRIDDVIPWLRAVSATRLPLALSGLIAELLADVVEFKYLASDPDRSDELISSSPFKDFPSKLDLTLKDLRIYVGFATRGLRALYERPVEQRALEASLAAACPDLTAEHRAAAVAVIVEATGAWLEGPASATWQCRETAEGLEVNLYTRLGLSLLGLHGVVTDLYRRLSQSERRYAPQLRDFRDLMVLATGSFYQHDPVANLWHLDEFLALHFEVLLDRLLGELHRSA